MRGVARQPFRFYSSSVLVRLTGERARNIEELLERLNRVSGSSIFHHTHHSFRKHSYAPGIQRNDFARWIAEELKEEPLAERLNNIDIYDFTEIRALRNRIVEVIEDYLSTCPVIRNCLPGHEFHFSEAISIVVPTDYLAHNLKEFKEHLSKIGIRSLYYHFFQARLRLMRKTNDFSHWIENSLKNPELARRIEALDLYVYSMEELRARIIDLISEVV